MFSFSSVYLYKHILVYEFNPISDSETFVILNLIHALVYMHYILNKTLPSHRIQNQRKPPQ